MGVLHELDPQTTIATLVKRGLRPEQIERAMKQIVGLDWREVPVTEWYKRLRDQGFILRDNETIFIDYLEALVNGRAMLDDIHNRSRPGGQA